MFSLVGTNKIFSKNIVHFVSNYLVVVQSFSTYENKYKKRAQWASAGSSVVYTPEQLRTLTPVREKVIERSQLPDLRDIFLCHAWDDRKIAAK